MKPIGKYIIIKDIVEEVKTQSGILLSSDDVASMRYKMANVIESGTAVDNIVSGDKIYYDKSSSFTMLIDGQQYTIIQERDVVVVV
jgi:co-chaperonin GroES (HSP10)